MGVMVDLDEVKKALPKTGFVQPKVDEALRKLEMWQLIDQIVERERKVRGDRLQSGVKGRC